jgi:hypothetical protein
MKMKSRLIGEKSAGMTAVEIYHNNGDLLWSHRYFADGATHQGYIDGLCQAWDDMHGCADVAEYEGNDLDDDGDPTLYDDSQYTGIMLEYDSDTDTWTIGDYDRGCGHQSTEIVDACMVAGLVDSDGEGNTDDNVVQAILKYINN